MLNDTKVRNAKPREIAFELCDGRGLFLLVTPAGGRLWRLKYHKHGREKLISLGAYPDVTPQRARDRRDAARQLIADDVDQQFGSLVALENAISRALLPNL
jgi:hypothetical protein